MNIIRILALIFLCGSILIYRETKKKNNDKKDSRKDK